MLICCLSLMTLSIISSRQLWLTCLVGGTNEKYCFYSSWCQIRKFHSITIASSANMQGNRKWKGNFHGGCQEFQEMSCFDCFGDISLHLWLHVWQKLKISQIVNKSMEIMSFLQVQSSQSWRIHKAQVQYNSQLGERFSSSAVDYL